MINKQEAIKISALKLFVNKLKINQKEVISIDYLIDGYTNNSFVIKTKDDNKYIVRIGSQIKHIDRNNEAKILKILAKSDECEIFYFNKKNGDMIRKFIDGHTLNEKDVHSYPFLKTLAKKINQFHQLKFDKSLLVNDYHTYDKIKLPIDKKYLVLYYALLEKNKKLPLVLSHNDLSPWNIIYDKKANQIKFIDFEWIRLNNIYFDIATFIHQADLYGTKQYYYFIKQFGKQVNIKTLEEFLYICAIFTYQWTFSTDSYKDASGFRNSAYILMKKLFKKLNK